MLTKTLSEMADDWKLKLKNNRSKAVLEMLTKYAENYKLIESNQQGLKFNLYDLYDREQMGIVESQIAETKSENTVIHRVLANYIII